MAEPVVAVPTVMDRLVAAGVKRPERAVERGLTAEDMVWNQRLSRPVEFKETVDPGEERRRRARWQAVEDAKARVAGPEVLAG